MSRERVDLGVNLTHKPFNEDRERVIEAGLAAGLAAMVITGTNEQASRAAHKLAATRPGVLFATAGVPPHHARDFTEDQSRSLFVGANNPLYGSCALQQQCRCYRNVPHN